MVVKKDPALKAHESLPNIPNLHVMMILKSLESREYVREKFTWQHRYYFLTDAGINYLRDYLHLPENTVPDTHKVEARATPMERGRPMRRTGDREQRSYRRADGAKKEGRGEFRPSFNKSE
jgi:small subunit ribosomal protein S10e